MEIHTCCAFDLCFNFGPQTQYCSGVSLTEWMFRLWRQRHEEIPLNMWRPATNGALQASVLGPALFNICQQYGQWH